MSRRKSMFIVSVTLTILSVAAMLMPALPLVPNSQAQTTSRDANGSSDRAPEELESSFDNAEAHDKESIEADPYAPDDTETTNTTPTSSTTTAAAAAAPGGTLYPISPLPLPGGLGHVANGAGMRNSGTGHIRLRGAPPGAVRVRAYLYWGIIQNAPPPTQTISFNNVQVTGRLIGTGPTCWCGGVFAAYRASVITQITPGINGDYRVRMPSAITNGSDPWNSPCMLPLAQGASLVVAYAHSSIPATARLYINDGTSFFAMGGINVFNPLPMPVPPYRQVKHTRLGGDGQTGFGTLSWLAATDERTWLGPPLTQIKGQGSLINLDSDWNGDDGVPLNQLWDTHTDTFNRLMVPIGAGGYTVRYTAAGDCIYAVAHILNVY